MVSLGCADNTLSVQSGTPLATFALSLCCHQEQQGPSAGLLSTHWTPVCAGVIPPHGAVWALPFTEYHKISSIPSLLTSPCSEPVTAPNLFICG